MKIIVDENDVVVFAGESLFLTSELATNSADEDDPDRWISPDTTSFDHRLLEVDSLPADWIGRKYAYRSGAWAVTPGGLTMGADALDRTKAATEIDDKVAAVYARFTRFQVEYEKREAQALAFRQAGYTGTVPSQVAAFAKPAGKTPQEATDQILVQADQLRGALDQLGILRMRKYEVLRAETDKAARAAQAEVLGAVRAIDRALG